MKRKMPRQKPRTSNQDQGTDPAFLRAFERRFGPIVWDLAAHAGNSVCGDRYFGPGSRYGENSLERAWDRLPGVPRDGWRWLNYEFSYPLLWIPKIAREAAYGINIAVLGPAAVTTEWFAEYVEDRALTLPLRPRVPFTGVAPNPKTGKVDPIPGGVMLMVFSPDIAPGFETWRWREKKPKKAAAHAFQPHPLDARRCEFDVSTDPEVFLICGRGPGEHEAAAAAGGGAL